MNHSAAAPGDLLIDIPGDEFPQRTGVQIKYANPVSFTTADLDNGITPTTVFNWIANDDPGSSLEITAFDFSPATGAGVRVSCRIVDDGNFQFPTEIQLSMGTDFISRQLFVARVITTHIEDAYTCLITQYINDREI